MEPAATPQEAAHAVDRVPEVERRVLVDRRAVGSALADQEAKARGELAPDASPAQIADVLMGIIQGAYVVAQGSADAGRYDSVIAGGLALLDAVTIRS